MNTLEIPVKKILVTYPSEWEEMTQRQAIYAGGLLYKLVNKKIDVDQFRKLMVDYFIRRVNNRAPSLSESDELDLWGNDWLLLETVNFFFKVTKGKEEPTSRYRKGKVVANDPNGTKDNSAQEPDTGEEDTAGERWEMMPTFTKNLIPDFKTWIFGERLYGPGDFMQGMTFAEYKDSLAAAMKYMETSDDVWLDRLVAILYRRKRSSLKKLKQMPDFDGRIRVAYNPGRVDDDVQIIRKVKPGIKYMSLMYVMGCLWNLKSNEDVIEIDGNKCDFSILFKRDNDKENVDTGIGMIGVMMALAESGVFGSLKDVANTDVWDVLVRMYQLEVDRMEFERRMEKHNK